MKTPSPDDLRFAAEWLRQYDDSHDGGKMTSIAAAVGDWLDQQAEAVAVRNAAREVGVSTVRFRAKLRELAGRQRA